METIKKLEGTIFCDLGELCTPQSELSADCVNDKWMVCAYETACVSGSMLIAFNKTYPQPVTLDVRLEGWHKIYIALFDNGKFKTYIDLQLSSDMAPTAVCPGDLNVEHWSSHEQLEEVFWKCADMTGQRIKISKLNNGYMYTVENTAAIAWLRFVPMTVDEVKAFHADISRTDTKRLHAHCDNDFIRGQDINDEYSDTRIAQALKDSDVEVLSLETSFAFDDCDISRDLSDYACRSEFNAINLRESRQYAANCDEIFAKDVALFHDIGIKLYAANRMSQSNIFFPITEPTYVSRFVKDNPQLYCKNRDGSTVSFLSYIYPETQQRIIDHFLRAARLGFDGVTLIFTRGTCLLFEPPFIERFKARYNGLDPRNLPYWDERLHGMWCEVMTDFLRKLRGKLDEYCAQNDRERMGIIALTYYSVMDSKYVGFDVETWAREGLIDGVVQSNMTVWEDLDDVWQDDDLSLIDLEKYAHKVRHSRLNVIKRNYSSDTKKILDNAAEYIRIA